MRRIAVTGGFGRLGQQVLKRLDGHAETAVIDPAPPPVGFGGTVPATDILNLERLADAFRGRDAIIHLAGADASWNCSAEVTFKLNAGGTWTVLEAARIAGVRHVVLCSSSAAIGITAANFPSYIAIDEEHPVMPTGTYGLSKQLGESMARTIAFHEGIRVICIRPCYIMFAEIISYIDEVMDTPAEAGAGVPGSSLYREGLPVCRAHIDPADAADAFVKALDYDGPLYSVFNICADDIFGTTPTLEYVRRVYARCPTVTTPHRFEADRFASLIDNRRAKEALGWQPQVRWLRN